MNADLDDTLAGLGADARRMVSAMKGAFPEVGGDGCAPVTAAGYNCTRKGPAPRGAG